MIQGICLIVGIIVTIATLAVMTDNNKDKESVKVVKIIVCTALALDILGAFLPTEKEIYAMYAAEHITPANIKATGELADKAVDKLIEKILKASKAVDAETAKDAKVKAEKNSTDEFLSVYYLDEIEEVPECVVNI